MKRFALFASISGFLAVALGSFAAHGLQGKVTPHQMEVWHTAVQYQMFHTLALLCLALITECLPAKEKSAKGLRVTCWCWVVGILLFSGSLYLLVLSGITKFGAITPLGGVSFLCGWLSLTFWLVKTSRGTEAS